MHQRGEGGKGLLKVKKLIEVDLLNGEGGENILVGVAKETMTFSCVLVLPKVKICPV